MRASIVSYGGLGRPSARPRHCDDPTVLSGLGGCAPPAAPVPDRAIALEGAPRRLGRPLCDFCFPAEDYSPTQGHPDPIFFIPASPFAIS